MSYTDRMTSPDRMSTDERRMLAETVAKVLTDTEPAQLVTTLDELGWFELLAEQPADAAGALFREQGRLAVSSAVLHHVMGAALLGAEPSATAPPVLLPVPGRFGAGGWVRPVPMLDPASRSSVPMLDPASRSSVPMLDPASRSSVDGRAEVLVVTAALDSADSALLAAHTPDGPAVLRVDAAGLARTSVTGLDPGLGLGTVTVTTGSAEVVATGERAELAWSRALALGRRLLAEELVGVVGEQQRLALDHVRSRQQFGKPIGAFQAVRHKLAEVHVAWTGAQLAVEEAWLDPTPASAALAKLLAAAAVELANGHCQQVLGGIGFTWEHAFHRYVRRGRVLAALLGTRAQVATELGGGLLAGELPELAAL